MSELDIQFHITRLGKYGYKGGFSDDQAAEYFRQLKNTDAKTLEKVIDKYISNNAPSRGAPPAADLLELCAARQNAGRPVSKHNCSYCKTNPGYVYVSRIDYPKDSIYYGTTSVCACPHCELGAWKHKVERMAYYNPGATHYQLDYSSQLDFGGEVKQLAENFSFEKGE